MKWFRRKRAGYFWIIVHATPGGGLASTWGVSYVDKGEETLSMFNNARDEAVKRQPALANGAVPVEFTVLPARL